MQLNFTLQYGLIQQIFTLTSETYLYTFFDRCTVTVGYWWLACLEIELPKLNCLNCFQNPNILLLGAGKGKQRLSLFMLDPTMLFAEKLVSDNCACFLRCSSLRFIMPSLLPPHSNSIQIRCFNNCSHFALVF